MKRILMLLCCVCALGGAVILSGCGPGLVAAGGGSVGAIFGLQGSDDNKKKDKKPPAPTTNIVPAVIVTSVVREETPARINYTLIDANNDNCSIEVQYSQNGSAFAPCFEGSGGEGTLGLSSNASGISHVFRWDFEADLGPQLSQLVTIRIRANDGTVTGAWAQLSNQTIGNDPPAFFNFAANGTDIILISFYMGDQSSDLGTLAVAYSIDQGQNFVDIDTDPLSPTYQLLGNPPTNLLATPGGSPGQFIWNAPSSLFDFVGDVILRVTPKDQPSGYTQETEGAPVVTDPFPVDTSVNGAPVLSIATGTDGVTFTGTVPLDVTLADEESNSAVVVVQYSIGGSAFAPATLVNQFSSGIAGPFITSASPTPYTIVWDALADIGVSGTFIDVLLVLTPADGTVGTPLPTDAFTIIGNAAPEVLDIQVLQDSGNIPVVIDIMDGQSDPVEILVEYSTDNVNYTALSQSDFVFGSLSSLSSTPFGEQNVLIWDSTLTFSSVNAAGVTLRITPTDHPPSSTPAADLTGAAFVSASFPIINDPSAAVPTSISVFTTDAAGTPHATSEVTVTNPGQKYFDNQINPSGAVTFTTFWKIVEQGADYGTLLDVGGGSLQYATGQITVSAPGSIADGDTFVIDDGLNGPQVFEFDDNSNSTIGFVPVFFGGLTTADEVGDALADAINGNSAVRIDAAHTGGGVIDLTHTVACKLGDATSVSATGNAADMVFSGSAGVVNQQMAGGDGTKRVLYQAPATPPAGSSFVTLFCEIDDPAYFTTVRQGYVLWWGSAPTGVNVTPNTFSLLVGGTRQFSAGVVPSGAPQNVLWSVDGGSVNGSISAGGLYTAPSSVPTTNPVTVRATSVGGIASGTSSVTVQPLPTSVIVTPPSANPPSWQPNDLVLGAAISFSAQVLPSAAPQGVNWRVVWNSQDWGSGNSTVGTINASGTYTAPATLPSPDQVRIDAVSQAAGSIFGSYLVDLIAPPPTSFLVQPSTASVFAGGAGQQFTTTNFVPSNANTSVIWFVTPSIGSVSQAGFYTPPSSVASTTLVTVTARSSVASPTVESSAVVTVNQSVAGTPTDVVITPGEGLTISASSFLQTIQFAAQVNPGTASQAVTWTMQGTAFGNLSSSGLYTPAATGIDKLVTVRATSQVSPFPFADVTVRVCGDGINWNEIPNFAMGRGQVSPVWDPFNARLWLVGGNSETAVAQHEDVPLYVDFSGGTAVGAYEPVSTGGTFNKTPSAIMCICDVAHNRLIAVVCEGTSDPVELFSLDLTKVDPPTVPVEPWVKMNPSGGGNAPKLAGLHRFHCWWDAGDEELQILQGNSTIYHYSTKTSGGGANSWLTPITLSSQGSGPAEPLLCAHAYDTANNVHYFVGADSISGGAVNRVWTFDRTQWKWLTKTSTGTPPTSGLSNPCAVYENNKLHVFSGRPASGSSYTSDLYEVLVQGSNYAWTQISNANERPLPRADAGFAMAGGFGFFLYGGEAPGTGVFGDLWGYDPTSHVFMPNNATNIRPQGRDQSTGAWGSGIGIVYGGVCDHGVDNGTWTFTYNAGSGTPTWTRKSAGGTRPPALWGAASVWDSDDNVLILYGGDTLTTGFSGIDNRCYAYSPSSNAWTLLSTGGPGKRREAALCYDSFNRRVWLFGGQDDNGSKYNDLWYLNLTSGLPGSWVNVATFSGSPPDPRTGATIGYNSRSNRLFVCGGHSTVSGPNSQLFSFSIATNTWSATSVGNTGSQENVDLAATIYDDEFARLVSTPSGVKKTQAIVAATGGALWQYMTPPPSANNSAGALGLYDRSTGRYYALFGERTILSRNIGSNNLRTFVVK